ncbi:MAG: hypothetical protein LUC41_05790, partial [Clostridiales bacterium]|nr:hypothetical protein [Clostridiales bacterium]
NEYSAEKNDDIKEKECGRSSKISNGGTIVANIIAGKNKKKTYAELFDMVPESYDAVRIEADDFSARTFGRLYIANVCTVGDLLRKKESDLEQVKGVGRKCLDEIVT